MADALTDFLVQDHHHATISPEALELMGKQASNEFLEHGVALNEAVVKLASQRADINSEQVKRVCEFANNATYLAMHDQDKVAGASVSAPHFDLADPARVIQDLSDGARPTVITPTDVAYGQQPHKPSASNPAVEAALGELFKQSTPDYSTLSVESAAEDVLNAKTQLKALQDHFSNAHETFDMSLKQASAEFYDVAKRHIMDGGSITDVIVAARSTGVDKEKVSQVMQPVVAALLREKVASASELSAAMGQLEKVAHRSVNQEHPLVTNFLSIITSYQELGKTATVLADVDEQLGRVDAFIQEKFFAGSSL
jgi:hypothetical protein